MRRLQPPLQIDFKLRDLLGIFRKPNMAAISSDNGSRLAVAYSIRTLWLTILESLELQPGDEVILSAINIPHMLEIVEQLKLNPVIVDIDKDRLIPSPDSIAKLISSRTKLVLIAHLFGSWSDLTEHASICHRQGIVLVEDCAQCFMGPEFIGTIAADMTFFSFGLIKRSTAGGGALALIKSEQHFARFHELLGNYQPESVVQFANKVLKLFTLTLLTRPLPYSILNAIVGRFVADTHTTLRASIRGFRRSSKPDLHQFRCSPHTLQSRLILNQWLNPFPKRDNEDNAFRERLQTSFPNADQLFPALKADIHSMWLFPIRTDQADSALKKLKNAGYDATRGFSSLKCLGKHEAKQATQLLEGIIYLCVQSRYDCHFHSHLWKQIELVTQVPKVSPADSAQQAKRPADSKVI